MRRLRSAVTPRSPNPSASRALARVEPYWRSQIHQQAVRFIAPLFAKPMLRSEVIAAIRADAGLSKAVRQEALALAETFPENASLLNETSRVIVSRPGADAAAYQRALHWPKPLAGRPPILPTLSTRWGWPTTARENPGRPSRRLKSLPEDTTNGVDACRGLYSWPCATTGWRCRQGAGNASSEGLAAAERGTHAGCSSEA